MTVTPRGVSRQRSASIPPLANGDRLSRAEFERRYEAMPELKKAELIEGEVFMPSPVSESHGTPHIQLGSWVMHYALSTPGLAYASDMTVRLDGANECQPDVHLRIKPEHGGRSRMSPEGYLEGAPDLVVEVAATTASIDLHRKLRAYERNGVREYLVYRARDEEVDWFVLREGELRRLEPDGEGVLRSEVFPGLRLDGPALVRGDVPGVLAALERGLASPEHAAFAADLAARGGAAGPPGPRCGEERTPRS